MAGLKVKVVERRADRRRRGGNRGVLPGLPQFDRRLHRQPAQPEGHRRPAPARARAADRRAARAELPARARRPLSPVGRRPDRGARSPSSAAATPSAMPPSTARSTWRSMCCASWSCRRRRTWRHGLAGLGELIKAGALGRKLRRLSDDDLRTLYDLFTKSAGEHLDDWFEDDLVKALFGFDAVVGNYASPYTPGTGYVLLHHAFGEVNGKRRVWGHAIGGMGAISRPWPRRRRATASRSRPTRRCASCWSRAAAPAAWCCNDGRVIRARRGRGQRQPQAVLHLDGAGRRARPANSCAACRTSAAAPAPSG